MVELQHSQTAPPAQTDVDFEQTDVDLEPESEVPTPQSSHSEWRMPTAASKIPLYVQLDSLVKMFGLCALQLAVCLSIAVMIHLFLSDLGEVVPHSIVDDDGHEPYLPIGKVVPLPKHAPLALVAAYWSLSLLNLILIAVNWTYRSRHPCNYISLALLTLCMGCFWGVSSSYFGFIEHMLFLGHMVVTLGTASAVCFALKYQRACLQNIVGSALTALCLGWTLGLALECLYLKFAAPGPEAMPWMAAGLCMAALFFIFCYMLHSLVYGATDDLIGLVGGMDASVMAVISLPYLLLLLACCVPSALQWIQSEPEAPAANHNQEERSAEP